MSTAKKAGIGIVAAALVLAMTVGASQALAAGRWGTDQSTSVNGGSEVGQCYVDDDGDGVCDNRGDGTCDGTGDGTCARNGDGTCDGTGSGACHSYGDGTCDGTGVAHRYGDGSGNGTCCRSGR